MREGTTGSGGSRPGWRITLDSERSFGNQTGKSPVYRRSLEALAVVLWGSLLAVVASVAGLVTLGSRFLLGDLSAVAFTISLFILICATEARS